MLNVLINYLQSVIAMYFQVGLWLLSKELWHMVQKSKTF